jgi:MFS family permease
MTPSRKRLLRVLLPLGIGIVLSLAGDLTLYAVLPAFAGQRGFSLGVIGLLLSANRLVRLGSNPLVGMLMTGGRRRGFVLAGFGLGTLSTLLYVLARGTGLFLAGRLLWGISWSLINIGSYCMLLDAAEEQDRGWASGVVQSFIFIGMALNPFLGGVLSDRFGFTFALTACTVISAAGFLLGLFTLPETHPVDSRPRISVTYAVRDVFLDWRKRLSSLRDLAHPQNAAANYVYFAASFIGDGILLSTLSLYLKTHYGNALTLGGQSGAWVVPVASAGGALLALRAVIAALVAPLAGGLSDRSNHSASETDYAQRRWQTIAWGIFLGVAGLVIIIGMPSVLTPALALPVGVALAASGSAIVVTVTPPLARDINPSRDSSTFLGLLATSADLGTSLAPLVTYALLDRLPLETIYALAAIGLGIGLPVIWLVNWRIKVSQSPQTPTQ